MTKLFGYDFEVEYRQGKHNVVADALSRRGEELLENHAISGPSFAALHTLRDELRNHPKAMILRNQIAAGTAPVGWTDVDGLLLFKGRVFLPDESSLWPQVLEQAHTMGHEGSEKTLHRIRAAFYSQSAHRRVREFVQGCSVC